tara:strand:+ start:237 stop:374 length:138 start_codon:yes stop_codon:yes gene_type:complete
VVLPVFVGCTKEGSRALPATSPILDESFDRKLGIRLKGGGSREKA